MSVSGSDLWIWYRSMWSVRSLRRLASTSRVIHSLELPRSFGPLPISPWTLVASTTSSRRPSRALPTISSDRPSPYTSAVSMKLTPASMDSWIIRTHSSSSVLPHGPNIMAPRQWVLTFTPVRPSVRYSTPLPQEERRAVGEMAGHDGNHVANDQQQPGHQMELHA